MKVKFVGEAGVDEGGLTKEFFQLITKELLDPSYTMFKVNEKGTLCWFNGNTFESKIKFELVGKLTGLAVYNSHLLEFRFPLACYKKLLGISPDLDVRKYVLKV